MGNSQGSVNQGHSTWLIDTREHVHVVLSTVCVCVYIILPVVPHEAVPEVSKGEVYI